MPECRMEVFAEATDYDPIVVIGEMAHVAGPVTLAHEPTQTSATKNATTTKT